MARLMDKSRQEVLPGLLNDAGTTNPMAVARLEKVIISMGVGRATEDKKRIELAGKDLATISGQKPLVIKARKSVSNFKVRQGQETGLKVTLRGRRMYEFLDRLIHVAIPRIRRRVGPGDEHHRGDQRSERPGVPRSADADGHALPQ